MKNRYIGKDQVNSTERLNSIMNCWTEWTRFELALFILVLMGWFGLLCLIH